MENLIKPEHGNAMRETIDTNLEEKKGIRMQSVYKDTKETIGINTYMFLGVNMTQVKLIYLIFQIDDKGNALKI